MKKLLLSITLCLSLTSCKYDGVVTPIEHYKGKGFIVIEDVRNYGNIPYNYTRLILKNKDSVFTVYVPVFDGKDLKVGDTL